MPPFPRPTLLLGLAAITTLTLSANGEAFRRAPRDASGRLTVGSLLIGCTTDPEAQKAMDRYAPKGVHNHRSDTWVSLDADLAVRADITDSVENLERHIGAISEKVYVEHFNDTKGKGVCYTYQGELARKLFTIMKPGARLYMDLYLAYVLEESGGFTDFANSEFAADHGVNPAANPFWFLASWDHFAKAVQPGSDFDTFNGREEVLLDYAKAMKRSESFMAGIPAEHSAPGSIDAYVWTAAELNLKQDLTERNWPRLRDYARKFYTARQGPAIIAFLEGIGFTDVRITWGAPNPFNGRQGEAMITATRPATGAVGGRGAAAGAIMPAPTPAGETKVPAVDPETAGKP